MRGRIKKTIAVVLGFSGLSMLGGLADIGKASRISRSTKSMSRTVDFSSIRRSQLAEQEPSSIKNLHSSVDLLSKVNTISSTNESIERSVNYTIKEESQNDSNSTPFTGVIEQTLENPSLDFDMQLQAIEKDTYYKKAYKIAELDLELLD